MNHKSKYAWIKIPAFVMAAAVFVIISQNAYAEAQVAIPAEAADPSCAEGGSCFLPSELTIGVGETVTWSNDGTTIHTVTSGNPSDGFDGSFDSGIIMTGETFSHTFTEAGQYDYYCQIHPWMQGTVIVV